MHVDGGCHCGKLRGAPRHYVKTAESGNRRAQAFCPDCGSRLYACAETAMSLGSVRKVEKNA